MKDKTKKMDVDENLHIRIVSLQTKLFERFRVKKNIQDITNEAIRQGLPKAEEVLSDQLCENESNQLNENK